MYFSHHYQVDQPLRAVIVFLAGFEIEGGAPELGAEFIMRKRQKLYYHDNLDRLSSINDDDNVVKGGPCGGNDNNDHDNLDSLSSSMTMI